MRRYALEHTMQTRDLGGYPTKNPALPMTMYQRVLRSDAPYKLSEENLSFLRGITPLVIDLRSELEYLQRPTAFEACPDFTVLHLTVEGGMDLPESEDMMPAYMMGMVEAGSLPGIFAALAQAESGVLIHCAAGKDRTGIVSALLLELAGVADADIIADYQVSSSYISSYLKSALPGSCQKPQLEIPTKPEFMEKFLELFRRSYGSAEAYLLESGLSAEGIEALRRKLLSASG